MANLSANETALQAELYLVRREIEQLRDDNNYLRGYLKVADKQVEEVCKKVDFYMDEVKTLRAENEVLKRTLIEAKTVYEEFSLFVWKAFVTEISSSARVCNRREMYEHIDNKFQSVISDDYVEQLRQAAKGKTK